MNFRDFRLQKLHILEVLTHFQSHCMCYSLSCARLFVTSWTVAHQTPLSKEFSRQDYWSGSHSLLQEIFLTQSVSSATQLCPTLQPHGLKHARFPCPSPTSRAYSNSCPSCWWCHPTISSSVIPFSSHLQSFWASVSFPMNQLSTLGGQSIGVSASASALLMNIQD